MELSEEKKLHAWVEQRGWNPDQPNEACRQAIARPPSFDLLNRADGDGCHFLLVYLEYDRFLELGGIGDDEGHSYALTVGTYVVLKHHGEVPSREVGLLEHAIEFQRWNDRVMKAASERMRVAKFEEGRDNTWLTQHRHLFEPAITFTLVQNGRLFPEDVTADRIGLARARIMHEEGRVSVPSAPAPMEEQLFFETFQFLTAPGRSISKYGPDGMLRLDTMKAKSALDADLGRTKDTSREQPTKDLQDRRTETTTPLDHARASELKEIAEALAAASSLKGRQKRAAEVIRDNLPKLLDESLSRRELAVRTKVSRDAIDAAWAVFQERVARKFG